LKVSDLAVDERERIVAMSRSWSGPRTRRVAMDEAPWPEMARVKAGLAWTPPRTFRAARIARKTPWYTVGMTMNMLTTAAALSDNALLARLQLLARHGRAITVELVAHLAELDTRKVLTAEAHTLFSFCRDVLLLSEHASYNRIEAARAVRKFPVILERMADGSLNLSTVRILAPHLTPDNHLAVLAEAAGKSKREVEILVARLAPRSDVPSTIRKLPTPAAPTEEAATPPPANSPRGEFPVDSPAPPPAPPATPPAHRPAVVPLAPARFAFHVTLGQEAHDDLRRLQELLCLEIPDADPARIVERALALLRRDVEKKKCAATDRPRKGAGTAPGSRDIDAAVERAVRARDENRCAFIGRSGRRCAEKRFIQLHHVDSWALGGGKSVDELSLRCARHNRYESERIFGPRDSPSPAP
jgi:hypothetical protein